MRRNPAGGFAILPPMRNGKQTFTPKRLLNPRRNSTFSSRRSHGGLALGILSSIPVISAGNVLCCLWVQAGGGLAAWFLNKQRPGGLKYGDGAFGGVFSGLIGAFVATLISIPVQILMFTPERIAEFKRNLNRCTDAARGSRRS